MGWGWKRSGGGTSTRSTLNISISPNRSKARRIARDSEIFRGAGEKCSCSCVIARDIEGLVGLVCRQDSSEFVNDRRRVRAAKAGHSLGIN